MLHKACRMEDRMAFIAAYTQAEGETVSLLCRRFGISRTAGYGWLRRFEEDGAEGLRDRSHAPHFSPHAVSEDIVARIVEVRSRHPTWGPKKIRAWLQRREPQGLWPAPSTIGTVLWRAGLVVPRKRRQRVPPRTAPFASCLAPNDVWCADFKGWFRTGNGRRCEPFTLSDAYSRLLLRCQAVARTDARTVWPILDAAFREYGRPLVLRSDNGSPFAGTGVGGLTSLAVKLIKAGVTPERIDPGAPHQNGRLERLHLTLLRDAASPAAATLAAQQQRFAEFRRIYNEERPHEALGQTPPAAHYQPSHRPYEGHLRSPDYAGDDVEIRQVRTKGEIKWRGSMIYLSQNLCGEPVGLTAVADGVWQLVYGPIVLGTVDAHGRFRRPKRERPKACGFVDNAVALPTTPQAPQPQQDIHR